MRPFRLSLTVLALALAAAAGSEPNDTGPPGPETPVQLDANQPVTVSNIQPVVSGSYLSAPAIEVSINPWTIVTTSGGRALPTDAVREVTARVRSRSVSVGVSMRGAPPYPYML